MNKSLLALPLAALASTTFTQDAFAFDGSLELSGQFAFSSEENAGDVISPKISAFIPLTNRFAISGDLGLGVITGGGQTETNLLNVFLGGHYMLDSGPAKARFGLGVALPTARPDTLGNVVALIGASAPRGLYDLWLYLPRTVSIVAPARVEIGGRVLGAAGDGALAFYIPEDGDPDFGFQLGGEVFVPLGLVQLGARLQVASAPTADTDLTQVTASPFLRLRVANLTARAGLLILLDDPLGPSLSDGNPIGLDLAVGFTW